MNIIQGFLASRAKAPKNPIVNDAPQVTRGEFNTLARAVEGLIEDLSAATTPEKLRKVVNAAISEAASAESKTTGFAAPRADGMVMPQRPPGLPNVGNAVKPDPRPPLALKALFTAPAGE